MAINSDAADKVSNLDAVLESLYLTDQQINAAALELEQLVLSHQNLSYQGAKAILQRNKIERQIFERLGFKLKNDGRVNILIIDDTPDNLRLLSATLIQQGYKVRSAISGKIAIESIKYFVPDLILLDILMPEMDGYQVCTHLKVNAVTRDIPVIFISAVDRVIDKVKAFGIGGADYITKPFHVEEVLVRVEQQLQLRNLQKRLSDQNMRLQQALVERKQLEERYRSMFENSVDGIFQSTLDGRFLRVNQALARIYGYASPEEMIAAIADINQQVYVHPGRRYEFVAFIEQYDTLSDFESQIYRKDGSIIWISEDVRAVKDGNGNLLFYEGTVKNITARKQAEDELRRERLKAERLLLNILPQPIAERLKRNETAIADRFDAVTVLFADLVDFTSLAAKITPTQLVNLLDEIFSAFDRLVEQYKLEKIKTIGDAYMAVGGLPTPRKNHAEAIADMALAMQQAIVNFQQDVKKPFQLRIGINSGDVVAGVIGKKKFSYDLWGDTVNIASRMESEGMAGKIQVTAATYELLKDKYILQPRGNVLIKGRGEMLTYWLLGKKE
ncbi:MAG TPA: diguanylate cyclase [Cyanobacteria bacterium UBA11372]|nr:diguanylate cyclase [Cyanobacteria bacterium UBA11372]